MAQSVQIHSIRSHYTEGTPCCQSRCGRAPSLHERRWFKQISILLFPELGATPRRFKTLKVFVWAISLHHFERDGVPASCSSSDAFLRSLSLSLSLSLCSWIRELTPEWIPRPMATGKRGSLLNLPFPGQFSFTSSLGCHDKERSLQGI